MMSAEEGEVIYKIVKAGSKQVVKSGAKKIDLPDDAARFLSRQLAFTFDLVKQGSKLNATSLSILLASKTLAIANLALGRRYDCAIAAVMLGISFTKAVGFTTVLGPGHALAVAAELLSEVYSTDKSCGVSDAVAEKVQEVSLPAYLWLDQGIVQWISRGG